MAGHKLLIVTDDQRIRERLRQELQAHHWMVIDASNGTDAVALAKQHAPDVILLDVSLPGLSSEGVAHQLKLDSLTCAIPIVIVTTVDRANGLLEPWATDAVRPTVAVPALLATLEHVLAKQKRRKPYVLVVDDEPDLVEILTAVLKERGFAASGASNGREAFEVIRSVKPDAILLDLDMPQVSGWQFLAQLRAGEGLGDIRVDILTGQDQSLEDQQKGRSLGAAEYHLKPSAPDNIIRALHLALKASASGGS